MAETRYCEKCNKTMAIDNFYQSNNTEKYPDRYMNICKKCLTMHVNNFDPDTYLWILQEIDVPYIPDEWNKLLGSYGKDPTKLTGMSILGRYLSKMKLKQYKDYRWKDNDFLQQLANSKIEAAMKRQGYSAAEITTAIDKATYELPDTVREPVYPDPQAQPSAPEEDYFGPDIEVDLTDEDKTYLRLKWGKAYKQLNGLRLNNYIMK